MVTDALVRIQQSPASYTVKRLDVDYFEGDAVQ